MTLEHRVLVHLGFLLSHGLRFDGSAPLFNPFNPKYQSLLLISQNQFRTWNQKTIADLTGGKDDPENEFPLTTSFHIFSHVAMFFHMLRCFWVHNPDVCHILFLLVASSNSLSLELSNQHSLACWSQQPSYSLTSMSATWPLRRAGDGSLTLWIWGDNATWPLSPQMVQVTLGASLDTTAVIWKW